MLGNYLLYYLNAFYDGLDEGLRKRMDAVETIHWCMWYLEAEALAGSLFKDRVFVADACL
jgi:hypothetical protein